MRAILPLIGGLVVLAAAPAPAQYPCTIPATNEWLSKGDRSESEKKLDGDRIRPVTEHISESITKLLSHSVLSLSVADVKYFTGKPSASDFDSRLRPYLVRAVYPTSDPAFDVRWDGRRLDVVTEGLGCEPYVKHPVVVFLERPPQEVYVMAFSAL